MRRSCLHVVWSLMWLSVASAQDASNPSERTLLDRIYFDVSATSLSADARATLDAVATVLHREAETVVHLAGHTDPSGRRWANVLLSRARAEAAKAYLVSLGVSSDRVSTAGHGSAVPIDPTPARNRRVDVYVIRAARTEAHQK